MDVRVFLIFGLIYFAQSKLLILSCDQIHMFVNGHNSLRMSLTRGEVLPRAAKINLIVWDDELASEAADWASKNTLLVNPDKTIPSRRFKIGQNIAVTSTTDPNYKYQVSDVLDNWFDEKVHHTYDFYKNTMQEWNHPNLTAEYTQMIWSESIYLGCGVSKFETDADRKFYTVCNYGPGGNHALSFPYKAADYDDPDGKINCPVEDCKRMYGYYCD